MFFFVSGKKRFTLEQCLEMLDDSDIDISDDELDDDHYDENNEVGFEVQESVAEDIADDFVEAGEKRKAETARIEWRAKEFQPPDITINRGDYAKKDSEGDKTPIDYFKGYFTEDLLEKMSQETNLYGVLANGRSLQTNVNEIRKFIGINILMGNFHLPRVKMYWGSVTRIPSIADAMPVNR